MTYDVPFLRHVTSNKTYDFCIFSKFGNVVPIDLKIGTHIDWSYTMYIAKTCISKSNDGNEIPIIKHRTFSKLLTIFMSTNNEDISH